VETCWQDLRLALRRLRMAPAFTIATVLSWRSHRRDYFIFTCSWRLLRCCRYESQRIVPPRKESRVVTGGYSQKKSSPCLLRSVKYFRDNTKFFGIDAFPRPSAVCVRRAGTSELRKAIQASLFQAITSRCWDKLTRGARYRWGWINPAPLQSP